MKEQDEDDIGSALNKKATLKVDISEMAEKMREFYARKEFCNTCELNEECPQNHDIIACIYGDESIH